MNLPTIENVSFTEKRLPSGKKIGLKPWRVKEEKELLFAIDAIEENADSEQNHLIEIINFIGKCTSDKELFKTLSNVDCLSLAAELRKMSKGGTIEYELPCEKCKNRIPDFLNISESVKIKDFDYTPIQIDEIIFTLKDVSFEVQTKLLRENKNISLRRYNHMYLLHSIDAITHKGQAYLNFTIEDLDNFIDQLDSDQYDKLNSELQKRISNVYVEKKLTCNNPKCKEEHDVNFGNLYRFFVF